MANEARQVYQSFLKKGLPKEEAFLAVLDLFNDQHWFDRNAYHERIKALESEVHRLKTRGQPE
jgi:hypothetical protein